MMLKTALHYSHELLEDIIVAGDIVIDATMGNGHDTLFLSNLVGEKGQVYSFDIQEQALLNTKKRLYENNALNNTKLILDSHSKIDKYVTSDIKAAIFNLGYLPSGDKTIITKSPSTIKAIESLLNKLVTKGRIIIVLYYGHDGGKLEKDEVLSYCSNLNQDLYRVMTYSFINQRNCPPICLCIEKK